MVATSHVGNDLALERVMNLGENPIEMRIPRLAYRLCDSDGTLAAARDRTTLLRTAAEYCCHLS